MTTTTRGPRALPTRTTDTQLLKDLLLKDLLIMYPTVAHTLLEDFTCDSCYYNHKTRAKRVTCADHGHTATQGLVAQGLVDHHSGVGFPERKTSPVTAAITATGRRRGALTDVGFSEMYSAIPDRSTHSSGHHAISHHSNRHRCTVAGRGQDDSHRKTAWRTYRRRVFRDVLSNTRPQLTLLRTPRHSTPQQPSPMCGRWAWAG